MRKFYSNEIFHSAFTPLMSRGPAPPYEKLNRALFRRSLERINNGRKSILAGPMAKRMFQKQWRENNDDKIIWKTRVDKGEIRIVFYGSVVDITILFN